MAINLYQEIGKIINAEGYNAHDKIYETWERFNNISWDEFPEEKMNGMCYALEGIFHDTSVDTPEVMIEEVKKFLMANGWTPPPFSIKKL